MQRNVCLLIILFTFMLFPIRAAAESEKEITSIGELLKRVNAQPKIPYLMETSKTAEYTDGSKLSASSRIFRDSRTGRYDLVYKETAPGRSTEQHYLYLPGTRCPFIVYYPGGSGPENVAFKLDAKEAGDSAGHTLGVLSGSDEYISVDWDPFLKIVEKNPGQFSIRKDREKIGDALCCVVEGRTKYGDYIVWLDPKIGFKIRKAELKRDQHHCYSNGRSVDEPLCYKFDDAEYKEIGGSYFLNKAKSITEFPMRTDRMKKVVVSSELKHAEANPDPSKHRAFNPGLPDRQIMQSMEDNLYYRWHDGAVIPLNAE